MIKKLALLTALALTTSSVFAGSGIFGSGVELNLNGTIKLFALDDSGGVRLLPPGSPATLDETSWNNSPEANATLDLGTFDPSAAQTLILKGGSLLTFKNSGSDVTGAFIDFRVFPGTTPAGSFTELGLPFNEDNVNGGTGDQRWAVENQSFNLLTGLTPGTYTLGVFLRETSTDGGAFSSNGGANYGATFTVAAAAVPEPSTLALLAGPALLGGWMFLRRRRA